MPISFKGAFEVAEEFIRVNGKPQLAVCSFDRLEMLGACLAFFLNRVKIAQYHAGDISGTGEVFDDYVRFMITLCSDFQFCNGESSFKRCLEFLKLVGKSIENCFEVGSMALDGVKLDYSLIPKEPYDLVLYNPPNKQPELIESELNEVERLLDKFTIWVFPNEDFGREKVIERIRELESKGKVKGYETLPREQFLALMERAERVIGNSSAFFLELSAFGRNHIHIGVRNKNRERVEVRSGASKRIAEILEKIF